MCVMAKRSIEDYRPRGIDVDVRYVSGELLDRLISVAGSVPDKQFVIEAFGPNPAGEWIDQELPARSYLHHLLEMAATAYHYQSDDSRKPTSSQLVGAFADIERVAKDLLQRLRVAGENGNSIDNMPYSLRYGSLRDAAARDAADLRATSRPAQLHTADTLMRQAIKGLDDIQRWARSAKNSEQDEEKPAEGARPAMKNEGDVALNEFLKTVVFDCWEAACGQELTVGTRLVKFAHLSAGAIERDLGDDDAVTKRLQRLVILHQQAG
jgi:hypothetical protein